MLVIGLGLLGGSAAMAVRQQGMARRIIALCRATAPHEVAKSHGVIDDYTDNLEEALAEADFILLAYPVEEIRKILPRVLAAAKEGAIITDVGSTKGVLVEEADAVQTSAHFVGSHPMAGSHLTGWENGRVDLFNGQTTYVTLTDKTSLSAAARVALFWQTLGSRIVMTHPKRHDRLAALLSHVPHFAAVALIQNLQKSHEDVQFLKLLAGAGLRDTTRIAMGNGQMWTEICHHNGPAIADLLRQTARQLEEFADTIVNGEIDDLKSELEAIAQLRQML